MPTPEQTISSETKTIKSSLAKLRSCFPGGTPDLEILSQVLSAGHGECNPEALEAFATRKKEFSTADVMQHFQVSKYKAAGSLAALSGAGLIKKTGEQDENGYTCYKWAGTRASISRSFARKRSSAQARIPRIPIHPGPPRCNTRG